MRTVETLESYTGTLFSTVSMAANNNPGIMEETTVWRHLPGFKSSKRHEQDFVQNIRLLSLISTSSLLKKRDLGYFINWGKKNDEFKKKIIDTMRLAL